MLDRDAILGAFERLAELLRERGVEGEVCLLGGTVMVLAFRSSPPWPFRSPARPVNRRRPGPGPRTASFGGRGSPGRARLCARPSSPRVPRPSASETFSSAPTSYPARDHRPPPARPRGRRIVVESPSKIGPKGSEGHRAPGRGPGERENQLTASGMRVPSGRRHVVRNSLS